MLGISLIIISTVLLCHTLGSQDMSGLEQRDSKWEGEQSTRWNMWTRLQLSRYAHYWQLRDRRSGGICLMKCSRSGEEGQGWVFLCSVRLFCLLSLTAQSSDGMYIPAYSWYPSMGRLGCWQCWQRDRARVNRCQHQVVRTVSQKSPVSLVSSGHQPIGSEYSESLTKQRRDRGEGDPL